MQDSVRPPPTLCHESIRASQFSCLLLVVGLAAPMMPNLMMKPSPQSTSSMASSSEVAYLEQLRNFQETEIEILRRKDAHLERMHAVQTQELMSLREKNVLYEKRIGELEEQVQQLLQAFPRLNGSNSAASNAASMSGDAAAMDHGEM